MDNTPDDLAPFYDLESLEQLRAIADELRLRILDHLTHQPLTVTQLGEQLGIAPAKAHYHVRELERVGLVRLVATRENRGILEKYYRTIARELRTPVALIQRVPADELIATARQFLDFLARGYLTAMTRNLASETPVGEIALLSSTIWTTDDEVKALSQQIGDTIKPFDHPRGIPGERERILAQLSYPLVLSRTADDAGEQPGEMAEPARSATDNDGTARRRHRAIAAGVLTYTRTDLERRLAQGYQLDIYALGTVIFADDVSPELAERAIGRFRLRGKLTAPPGVREVLERKQRQEQKEE